MSLVDQLKCDRMSEQRAVAAIPSFFLDRKNTPKPKKVPLDLDAISIQIVNMLKQAISPLIIGTTGESPTLKHKEEELDLIDMSRETINHSATPLIPLVVGTGSNDTDDACEYTEDAVAHGADAILSVFPYYNKPNVEGQLAHFGHVAQAAAGKPVIIYNIPGRTGGNGISPETLAQLAGDYSNIVGVKECNQKQLRSSVISKYPEGFKVWTGEDGHIVEHMKAGAFGAISVLANADPEGTRKIVDLCAEGNFDEADIVHRTRHDLIDLLFAEGNPQGIKGACHILGIGNNQARLPVVGASKALLGKLEEEMRKLGLVK